MSIDTKNAKMSKSKISSILRGDKTKNTVVT